MLSGLIKSELENAGNETTEKALIKVQAHLNLIITTLEGLKGIQEAMTELPGETERAAGVAEGYESALVFLRGLK